MGSGSDMETLSNHVMYYSIIKPAPALVPKYQHNQVQLDQANVNLIKL